MNEIMREVFDYLDLSANTGLITKDDPRDISSFQSHVFTHAREKLGIDAVYFLRDANGVPRVPLIYFSLMQSCDTNEIASLHRLAWNLGEAPLLFVVTPSDLLIYNNYEAPRTRKNGALDPKAGMIEALTLADGLAAQRAALENYRRSLLESGECWRRSGSRFSPKSRVDTTLLANLKMMRGALVDQITRRGHNDRACVTKIVHSLLCRSILIKYLEERKDANGESVFPRDFYLNYLEGADKYADVLTNKEATYDLFAALKLKFNGDVLKVTDAESKAIEQEDLDLLRAFILGTSHMESKQLALWPLYNFDIIPIQLISSIYELFFHLEEKKDFRGTHYTPLHLVSLLMDEIYPWEGTYDTTSFFDPSCGSGIFLVEAYRRLVFRWMAQNKVSSIGCKQLTSLLESSVFGVDINGEAIRVASFSLCLAMCDFLESRAIWNDLTFPNLLGTNLITGDFFDMALPFNNEKYEYIIGNPPWQSHMTSHARTYLGDSGYVVGDNQIAEAFSLKCSELCTQHGLVGLVMPSKGLLFNKSERNKAYRENLFENNDVLTIINLSLYRKQLFSHASGPAAVIIYKPTRPGCPRPSTVYCTPKPSFTAEDSWKFSIDPTDICHIPYDITHDGFIWKTAMWGTPRDHELVKRIQRSFPPLESFLAVNDMIAAEGIKVGNKAKECRDFVDWPLVKPNGFKPFYQTEESLSKMGVANLERTATKSREIFLAPHLLIKQSPQGTTVLSEVLDYDAVFGHSFLGVHGDINKLKYLCIIIGSRVFSYYHILTSRKWLVERDELEAGDIKQTPIPHPTAQEIEEACAIFDGLVNSQEFSKRSEEFSRRMYRLDHHEGYQIDDIIDCAYGLYKHRQRSAAYEQPNEEAYRFYYEALVDVLVSSFGTNMHFSGDLYSYGNAPLSVLRLNVGHEAHGGLSSIVNSGSLDKILSDLDSSMTDDNGMLFVKRNLRIYQSDAIYIVKPHQRRYWTRSAAYKDADEIFRDVSKAWR